MMTISKKRPLVSLDMETTGLRVDKDRIITIALVKECTNGSIKIKNHRLNPGIAISPEATKVHGINDDDVAECPYFSDIATEIWKFLDGCDLVGYNIKRYDFPLLRNEFRRVGLVLDLDDRHIIDVMQIYHERCPRSLTDAARFYLGVEHKKAHSALADARVTAQVFHAQLAKYTDLPKSVEKIHDLLWDPIKDGSGGFLCRRDGDIVVVRGEHRGKTINDVASSHPSYLQWIITYVVSTKELKKLLRNCLHKVGQETNPLC